MNLLEILRPTKTSLRITLNYSIFLVLLSGIIVFLLLYIVRWAVGSFYVQTSHETEILILFFTLLFILVYLGGQLLTLWLGRYSSGLGIWIVTGIGTFLSIAALMQILFMLNNSPRPAMDARIVANVKQLQTVLELYYNDAGRFPAVITPGDSVGFGEYVYINEVPDYFINQVKTKRCPAGTSFSYTAKDNGQSYEIKYCIGEKTGRVPAGINIATEKKLSTRIEN